MNKDGKNDGGGDGFGLRRLVAVVLVMFVIIVGVVAGMALFGADDGMLPFDYEGF